jgi:putative methyltransferase
MSNRLDHVLEWTSKTPKTKAHIKGEREYSGYDDEDDTRTPTTTAADSRLQSLADFQLKALQKAFSFPNVMRVVYSTCSIFETENEVVVASALATIQPHDAFPFHLVKCLPTWPRRGRVIPGLTKEDADCLVRVNAIEDGTTNGFFVAYFERRHSQEKAHKEYGIATEDHVEMEDHEDDDGNDDGDDVKKDDIMVQVSKKRKKRSKDKNKRRKKQKQSCQDAKDPPTLNIAHSIES